jgi:hypothetical protein
MFRKIFYSFAIIILLLFQFKSNAQVIEQDSLALVAFYNSTGGPNWDNNSNWLTGPVSIWYGITVEGDRVTELKFYSDNNLNGFISEEIGNLNELVKLIISNNPNLTGVLPETIGQLIILYGLGIGNCSCLEFLNLPQNNLTGSIPPEIGNLDSLIFLDLHDNQLTGSIPPVLGNLDNLLELRLNKNNLTGKLPVNLGNILDNWYPMQYVFFDVSENQLIDSIPFSWANIEMFNVELDLSSNYFTDIPPWNSNWILNYLNIASNKMTFEDIEPHFVGYSSFVYAPQQFMCNEVDTLLTLGSNYRIYSGTAGEYTYYQWSHNYEAIQYGSEYDTLVLENISYADTGIYYCYATNSLATGLTLIRQPVHITIDTSVNVLQIPGEINISITPNPSNGIFNICLPKNQTVSSICVYNLGGMKVYKQKTIISGNRKLQIDLSHLSPGQYIIKLKLKNKIQTGRIIIF